MSQPRMRKVVASGDAGPRARASVAKASGDTVACAVRPNPETLRSRSKNKIPKSVRYDLENALVGLCDVWFEEIKPHLVRNNIKLHVHGSSAGGDHERPAQPASPAPPAPPARPVRPAAPLHPAPPASAAPAAPASPNCSHLDPASSAGGCELCRLLFNAANCIESAVCQAAHAQLSPPVAAAVSAADSSRLHTEKQMERPRTRRKKRRHQPQPQSSWRVPRLCRTYSVPSPAATGSRMRRIASHLPPQPPRDNYFRFILPRRESVMKNKATQTNPAMWCVSKGCQSEESGMSRKPGWHNSWSRSLGYRCPVTRSPGSRSPGSRSPGSLSPGVRSPDTHSPAPGSPNAPKPDPRSPGTSPALSLPRNITYRLKRPEPTVTDKHRLFQDDLIDIIGETNDKRLRLLYSSPEKDDYPSFMNLFPLHNSRQEKPGGQKKLPPWR